MFMLNEAENKELIEKSKSLTTKASLSAVSNGLQFVIRLLVSFVITPIIIQGLGKELYGAWTIIQQTLGYVALADLRATSVIKLTLAVRQHDNDVHYKRQQVGASLLVLALVSPIILGLGAVVIWFAPVIIRTDPQFEGQVRWALGIGLVGIIVDLLSSIPGNILRGVNLEYKSMGLNALVLALTSTLSAFAVWLSTGLPGLAVAIELGGFIIGTVQYFVARSNVLWLGVERPPRDALKQFWNRTVWAFLSSIGYVMQNSSDLLVVGIVLGPAAAAVYGITGLALRMFIEPLFAMLGSANPGIAELCGRGEWKRVEKVRNETHLVAFLLLTVLCSGVLVLNKAFLGLWLGTTYYTSHFLNLLLVVIAIQSIPLRLDTMTLDSMLKFKDRAVSTIFTSALGIVLGVWLAQRYGVEGIAMGAVAGRLLAICLYQIIISRGSDIRVFDYICWMVRPLGVGFGLLAVGYAASFERLNVVEFVSAGGLVLVLAASTMWFLGISTEQRGVLIARFKPQISVIIRYVRRWS